MRGYKKRRLPKESNPPIFTPTPFWVNFKLFWGTTVLPISAQGALGNFQIELILAGTKHMLVEFGKTNLLEKARQEPEKVKQVLDKPRANGLASNTNSVQATLGQPIRLCCANCGIVAGKPERKIMRRRDVRGLR